MQTKIEKIITFFRFFVSFRSFEELGVVVVDVELFELMFVFDCCGAALVESVEDFGIVLFYYLNVKLNLNSPLIALYFSLLIFFFLLIIQVYIFFRFRNVIDCSILFYLPV